MNKFPFISDILIRTTFLSAGYWNKIQIPPIPNEDFVESFWRNIPVYDFLAPSRYGLEEENKFGNQLTELAQIDFVGAELAPNKFHLFTRCR